MILTAREGADVKSVMSLLNSTGFAVISLASSRHQARRRISKASAFAVSPGDPLGQLFQAVAAANKLDMSKITLVQVDPAAKVVSVLEKKADALLGGADDQYFLIKQRGIEPAALRFADHGANIVGMTMLTQERPSRTSPTSCAASFAPHGVVGGSQEESRRRGRRRAQGQARPEPPVDARPADGRHRAARLAELEGPHRLGRAGRLGPDASRSSSKYRDLETDKPWTAFHTNEFVPK